MKTKNTYYIIALILLITLTLSINTNIYEGAQSVNPTTPSPTMPPKLIKSLNIIEGIFRGDLIVDPKNDTDYSKKFTCSLPGAGGNPLATTSFDYNAYKSNLSIGNTSYSFNQCCNELNITCQKILSKTEDSTHSIIFEPMAYFTTYICKLQSNINIIATSKNSQAIAMLLLILNTYDGTNKNLPANSNMSTTIYNTESIFTFTDATGSFKVKFDEIICILMTELSQVWNLAIYSKAGDAAFICNYNIISAGNIGVLQGVMPDLITDLKNIGYSNFPPSACIISSQPAHGNFRSAVISEPFTEAATVAFPPLMAQVVEPTTTAALTTTAKPTTTPKPVIMSNPTTVRPNTTARPTTQARR
jgi:hypothetical protein